MSENPNYQQNPGEFIPRTAAGTRIQHAGRLPRLPADPELALAIASLILGIIGLLTGLMVFGAVLGLVGVILGIVALVKVKNGTASGKGMAIGGIVTGALGMIAAAAMMVLGIVLASPVR